MYVAKERLYINADRSKIVPEDSPEATFLLAAEGQGIDDDEAKRLGLLDPPKTKAVAPQQNKAERAPGTK